jgi:hypothetical protein
MPNNKTGKFSFSEVVSETPDVVLHDLQRQLTKKRQKGGDLENQAIKRAELECFEIILKKLNLIESSLKNLELKKYD